MSKKQSYMIAPKNLDTSPFEIEIDLQAIAKHFSGVEYKDTDYSTGIGVMLIPDDQVSAVSDALGDKYVLEPNPRLRY